VIGKPMRSAAPAALPPSPRLRGEGRGEGRPWSETAAVETPSGKGRGHENFPVGSLLIRRDLRPHVHAFYRFARNADDIADNPLLSAGEKIRRLDRMAAILDGACGDDSPAAAAMRQSLARTGITAEHCHDVLRAFRLDAVKLRYRDWDDLMGYCRYSAAPVGRQLLDLHGESRVAWPASDALCAALQVLNHLQDCVADYRRLDRVYLPTDYFAEAGIAVTALAAAAASPPLRRIIDRLLDRTEELVAAARALPRQISAPGLGREAAVILALAARLLRRLRRGDPVATRVGLTKADFVAAFLTGVCYWGPRTQGARGWGGRAA
jgi:squalene synthase HpnC